MEFLALVSKTSICGEINGGVAKCWQFSQEEVKTNLKQKILKEPLGQGVTHPRRPKGSRGMTGLFNP